LDYRLRKIGGERLQKDEEVSKLSLKEVTLEVIRRLPDECSLEDIMYEINFIAQVLEGLKEAESGKLLTTEELLSRVKQWAK
jgi:hypothetical protein